MNVFEPVKVGTTEVKNRLIRSATWLAAATPQGDITDELTARYEELARGGCGLIVTGFAYISPEGAMLPAMIGVDNDNRIEGLKKLTNAVHDAAPDAKIFCQIVHTGIFRLPFVRTTYADTFAADETADPFVEMGGTGETCAAASEERIKEVIGLWADAAMRCKSAGFDGVELHFGHGFGASTWLSPLWNHRTDAWGGSVENRSRYGMEIYREVRNTVGDWPVTAKINCEDGMEGGVVLDDVSFFANQLANEGVDGLIVSGGSAASGPKLGSARLARAGVEGKNGEGYFSEAASVIRKAVNGNGGNAPVVIGVGGWRSPAIMKKHLGTACDAFAFSRPFLNDYTIVKKWQEDPDYKTGCISCNKCLQGQGIVVCRKDEK